MEARPEPRLPRLPHPASRCPGAQLLGIRALDSCRALPIRDFILGVGLRVPERSGALHLVEVAKIQKCGCDWKGDGKSLGAHGRRPSLAPLFYSRLKVGGGSLVASLLPSHPQASAAEDERHMPQRDCSPPIPTTRNP